MAAPRIMDVQVGVIKTNPPLNRKNEILDKMITTANTPLQSAFSHNKIYSLNETGGKM